MDYKCTNYSTDVYGTIFDFINYSIVAKLKQQSSPLAVYFLSQVNDSSAVEEVAFLTNTGAVTYSNRIPQPDLTNKLNWYQEAGFSLEYINNTI